MTAESGRNLRWPVAGALAILLLVTGATVAYLVMREGWRDTTAVPETPRPAAATPSAGADARSADRGERIPDVVVSLSGDLAQRAGIRTAPVETGRGAGTLRLPATVEPNAYRQVAVTPLVGGRVTRVFAELGTQLRQGQTMAQIFSPELAEAESRFVAASAELDAHERELARTEKLVQIGSASRQELERIHAEHTAKKSGVEAVRARLQLLGVSPAAIAALGPGKETNPDVDVPAPIAGVVTERFANVGLNVDPQTKLFTIVDMSSVWVVADLYEKDLSRVHAGDPAVVTTTAYPDRKLTGRISYIDPQLNPQSRTARLRVEVSNVKGELRLGMFADVRVETAVGTSVLLIPRSGLQNVDDRTLVYLASSGEGGRFTEREVRVGESIGDRVEVLSGLAQGDSIVTAGSFFLRAEVERLGLRQSLSSPPQTNAPQGSRLQTEKIIVSEKGYEPATVSLRAGVPARLTFVRTTDKTCGTEVVFPSLKIERALPLDKPVDIDFTPSRTGDMAFACGMDMLRGKIVVR